MIRRTAIAVSLIVAWVGAAQEKPLVRFGVVADIQYADKDAAGNRDYRASLGKLEKCVKDFNGQDLAFAIQLGDLADEGEENLGRILAVFNKLTARKYHVIGNHDAASFERRELMTRLGMGNSFYEFAEAGWRFVVLDAADLSVKGGWPESSEHFKVGVKMLEELQAAKASNAVEWNGGAGERQLKWLMAALERARQRKEKVIVFCHAPVLRAASTPAHLMWNYLVVRQTVEQSGVAAAYINGHDHNGGYAVARGIHHVTVPGMVEAEAPTYAVVEVYRDRLELKGMGNAASRVMRVGK